MLENKASAPHESREKRDLGFVKLRRGLKEHLHRSRMSSNAVVLFVRLLLTASYCGPKKGCVEANYEDLKSVLGWNHKLVQRTIRELSQKGYVQIDRAANQHEVTSIKILKFDGDQFDSAVDTRVHTANPAVDIAVDKTDQSRAVAVDKTDHSNVHSSYSTTLNAKGLRASKNVLEVEQVEVEEKAAASTAALLAAKANPAWKEPVGPPIGSRQFRTVWEGAFASRPKGQKLSDTMEHCILVCQESEIPVPKPFYDRKRIVEKAECEKEDRFPTLVPRD